MNERWRSETGEALAEEVVARLISDRSLDGLGLESNAGLVDLRWLQTPLPRRLERFEREGWFIERLGDVVAFRGVRLEAIDFSDAQLSSLRFHDCTIAGRRFDRANLRDWRLWNTEVVDSTFSQANMRGAAVGTWHEGRRNTWRRADFSGSDFRIGVSYCAAYEDCNFSSAKLDGVEFGQCEFTRCHFSGLLARTTFDGRDLTDRPAPQQMDNVDFSSASFDQVEFKGFDLENVKLPQDPDIRLFRRARCVARNALAMIAGDTSEEARVLRALLERRLRGPGSEHDADLYNRRDYLVYGGARLVTLADEVLTRAEAACSEPDTP